MSKVLLLKNTAYYGIIPSIPKVVNIVLLPLLTANLTSKDYGIAGIIVAYTSALSAFSTLGCATFLTSSFYRYGERYIKIWRQIYGLLQYWMILFAVVQAILLFFIIPDAASDNKWWIILLTNFNNVLFGPAALIGSNYYRLKQRPQPIVYRSLIGGLITVFANLYLIVFLKLGYMGWYISSFAGVFVVNASYWYSLNVRIKIRPDYILNHNVIKHTLKVSLPTIPHFYSSYLINGSNKFLMDRFNVPVQNIGRYNFAAEFYSYFELFGSAVNSAVSPMFLQAIKDNNTRDAHKLFKQSLLFFSITVVLFIIWSREIFQIMVKNEELRDTYILASVLIAGFIHRPVYLAVSCAMFYYEKTAELMKISLSSGVIAFLLYSIFIPIYGIWAAAFITYFSLNLLGYLGCFFQSTKQLFILPYSVWKIFAFLQVLLVMSFFIIELAVLYKMIISLLGLVVSCFFFKKV